MFHFKIKELFNCNAANFTEKSLALKSKLESGHLKFEGSHLRFSSDFM